MKIAYFDCIAGASGDMILGALIDVGLPQQELVSKLSGLHLNDFELQFRKVKKNAFAATKVDVIVKDDIPERHLHHIKTIVEQSSLSSAVKNESIKIFQRLCEVEAGIHDSSPEQVHLHELGGVDTIVDVVGTLAGLEALGVERVYSSPLPMGRGFIKGVHGQIPLPAPATLALLKGVPITGSQIDAELVTPTGAVLLTSLSEKFGPIPQMTLDMLGYGAGGRDLPIANILRVLIGEQHGSTKTITEELVLLETNIDDQNPELYDYVIARLFDAGALDVFLIPIQMKKNRPATLIQVLCEPEKSARLEQILFTETSTLGVRKQMIQRNCLPRRLLTVKTDFGDVKIKVADLDNGRTKRTPEYEDCKKLAERCNVPLRDIYFAAEKASRNHQNEGDTK